MIWPRRILVGLWVLAQGLGAGLAGLFLLALLGLRYDEMHTVSTAFDPDPSLTRRQVIQNIASVTASWSAGITAFAVLVFAVNHALLEEVQDIDGKKISIGLAFVCWLIVLLCILLAGHRCYIEYGARPA